MTSSSIPLIARAFDYGDRLALLAPEGEFSYRRLLETSGRAASGLLGSDDDLNGQRVAYLIPRGFIHVAVQWGIWRAGGIAVPLCDVYPPAELEYVIRDSGASKVVVHPDFAFSDTVHTSGVGNPGPFDGRSRTCGIGQRCPEWMPAGVP